MRLTGGDSVPRRRLRDHTAGTAVVADAGHRGIVDDGGVVRIGNVRHIDVVHCTVVPKGSAIPIPALIAEPGIPESVIDPAIEAAMTAPIPGMPEIQAISPGPVTRS